ncbi:hypothetical protein ASD74_03055 [Rhizobium sp. Root564]|nr:hypothetical protein ASD74_03055 [Rhizobium sp. Root564]
MQDAIAKNCAVHQVSFFALYLKQQRLGRRPDDGRLFSISGMGTETDLPTTMELRSSKKANVSELRGDLAKFL